MSQQFDRAYEKANEVRAIGISAKQQIRDIAKSYDLDKSTARHLVDFFYTKGNGWADNNPLKLDAKFEGKYDIMSKLFIKLLSVINDFQAAGLQNELMPYLDMLYNYGVTIKLDDVMPNKNLAAIRIALSDIAANDYSAWYDASNDLKEHSVNPLVVNNELLKRHFNTLCSARRKAEKDKSIYDVISNLKNEATVTMNETSLLPDDSVEDEQIEPDER